MIGQMVVAIALLGFNNLGRPMSDPYFTFDGSFLYRFSMFSGKMNKIY